MSQQMSQNSSNNAQAQAALGSDYINRVRALVSSLKESLAVRLFTRFQFFFFFLE